MFTLKIKTLSLETILKNQDPYFNAHWVRNINYVNVRTTRKLLV